VTEASVSHAEPSSATTTHRAALLTHRVESVAPPADPLIALLCAIKLESVLLLELLYEFEAHHALFVQLRALRSQSTATFDDDELSSARSDVESPPTQSTTRVRFVDDDDIALQQRNINNNNNNKCIDGCSKNQLIDQLHSMIDGATLADYGDDLVQERCRTLSDLLAHSWTPLTAGALRLLELVQVMRSPTFAVARLAAVQQMTIDWRSGAVLCRRGDACACARARFARVV
jgi:hypothetical protein